MNDAVKKALENLQEKVKKKKTGVSKTLGFLKEFTKVNTPTGKNIRLGRMDAFNGRILTLECRTPIKGAEPLTREWAREPIWTPFAYCYKVANAETWAVGKFVNNTPQSLATLNTLEDVIPFIVAQIQAN